MPQKGDFNPCRLPVALQHGFSGRLVQLTKNELSTGHVLSFGRLASMNRPLADLFMSARAMSKVAGLLVALWLGIFFFSPDARASCQLCAGKGCSIFCQYGLVGWTECNA